MLSQDVCPSVCPSVTRWYSVEAAKHILKLFSPSGSHTVLVFSYNALRENQKNWHVNSFRNLLYRGRTVVVSYYKIVGPRSRVVLVVSHLWPQLNLTRVVCTCTCWVKENLSKSHSYSYTCWCTFYCAKRICLSKKSCLITADNFSTSSKRL